MTLTKKEKKFCFYWNPCDEDLDGMAEKKRKVIAIYEDTKGEYHETDYPRMTKDQIMYLNRKMGLTDNEVYDICQYNCKIIFAFEPKGIRYNKGMNETLKNE